MPAYNGVAFHPACPDAFCRDILYRGSGGKAVMHEFQISNKTNIYYIYKNN